MQDKSQSWCTWTTFGRLGDGYWTAGLPRAEDVGETYIADSGVWSQPFLFSDLAHILIPATFMREFNVGTDSYEIQETVQDLDGLSAALTEAKIVHRKTERVLEIKLY